MSRVLVCLVLISLLFPARSAKVNAADPYEQERHALVAEFVEKEGVSNPRVLQSMRATPRHQFIPLELRLFAYQDQAVSIGHEQTISPPFIVAYMTEMLDPQPTDRVLEIGTGSGYQAAVLSPLVDQVYTIEIVEPLGKRAASTLKRLQYRNVFCKIGDGYQGWPEHAPFDKIIVTCSPEKIPQPLIDQLREGGRMIIPLGERYQQVFYLLEKQNGKLVSKPLQPTLFVPMTGLSEQRREVLPNPRQPRLINGSFELDENNDGFIDGFHYQRRLTRIAGNAPDGDYYIQFDSDQPGQIAHMLQGVAIDGRYVRRLRVNADVWLQQVTPGKQPIQRPGIVIHFFDENRKPLPSTRFSRWEVTPTWQRIEDFATIPTEAREAIFQIGLNGAQGLLTLDHIVITPQ